MTAPANTAGVLYGVASDAALANVALTDAQLNEFAYSPPPVSTTDTGWYRAASKVSVAVKSNRQTDFPVPRALATGAAGQRLPVMVAGHRFSVHLESVEAGRPWALDRLRFDGEVAEGLESGRKFMVDLPGLKGGMDQSKPPTKIDLMKASDLKNVTYQGGVARSRRGYRVINNESTTV